MPVEKPLSQTTRIPDFKLPFAEAGHYLSDLVTPTLRLGVTGLSRSGKTVFITGLVQALINQNAQPAFKSLSRAPGFRCYLEPQPDDDVPRFSYEDHLAALNGGSPLWPDSTRRISQLRLTLEWEAQDFARQIVGLPYRLHIDIIDYPGEWLIDLGLLDQSFEQWSTEAIGYARSNRQPSISEPFLAFCKNYSGHEEAAESVAIEGAKLFTAYLTAARRADPSRSILGPGRFLLPGDLQDSPLITFFPLELAANQPAKSGTLHALLERRFESYKSLVVKPFFEKHFSRLDRQIVLIDVLTALNGGAAGITDLEHGLDGVLRAFRPGANSWLSFILPRRIDRIAFAASKADHIHVTSHGRLEAILDKAVSRAARRSHDAGAVTQSFALSALRATEDVDKEVAGDAVYHCVRGRPGAGEKVGTRAFDGSEMAVVFPGDLPDDPLSVFEADVAPAGQYAFTRFAPPLRSIQGGLDDGSADLGNERAALRNRPSPWDQPAVSPWPHIGMEHIFDFLFGDHLP